MRLRTIFAVALPIVAVSILSLLFFNSPFAKGANNYTETTTYFLADHLGSIDVVMDDQGKVIERADYLPFGSDRLRITSTTGPSTGYKFTGKEMDDETGLMYYGARYYDSEIGRFVSEDPLFLNLLGPSNFINHKNERQDVITDYINKKSENGKESKDSALKKYLSNPQHLNAYNYVINNPLQYIDPTGEDEYHFSFTLNIGLGVEGGSTVSFGFATDGSYGVVVSNNVGGLAGYDASVGVELGYSDAETWSDTGGQSVYIGGGTKVIFGPEITANFGVDGSRGSDIGIGAGLCTPIYVKGGVNQSHVIVERNIKQDLNNIKQKVDKVANATVNFFKEHAKIINNHILNLGE